MKTVHYLFHGLPVCKFTNRPPSAWAEGHLWVGIGSVEAAGVATSDFCSECVRIAKEGAEPPIHARIVVGIGPTEFVQSSRRVNFPSRTLLQYEGPEFVGDLHKHYVAFILMNQTFEITEDQIDHPLWEWEGVVKQSDFGSLEHAGNWWPIVEVRRPNANRTDTQRTAEGEDHQTLV